LTSGAVQFANCRTAAGARSARKNQGDRREAGFNGFCESNRETADRRQRHERQRITSTLCHSMTCGKHANTACAAKFNESFNQASGKLASQVGVTPVLA
jgi:hypothetical protein